MRIPQFLFVFFCLFSLSASGQQYGDRLHYLIDSLDLSALSDRDRSLIDSSISAFHTCQHDTCRAQAVGVIVEGSWDDKVWPRYNEWVLNFANNTIDLHSDSATQRALKVVLAGAINNQGYWHTTQGETEQALNHFRRGLDLQQEIQDLNGSAGTLINIGHIYLNRGLIEQALESYFQGLRSYEKADNQAGVGIALNGIGYIYFEQGDLALAEENYLRSFEIRKQLGDQYGIATCLNNLGLLYKEQGKLEDALNYYQEGMIIEEKLSDRKGVGLSLGNIGLIYHSMGKLDQARSYFDRSLEIREELNDRNGASRTLISLARVKMDQGDLPEAERCGKRGMVIARELGFPVNLRDAAEILGEIARKQQDWKQALEYQDLFMEMRDSISNEATKTAAIEQRYKYQYERDVMADSIRLAESQKLMDAEVAVSEAVANGQRNLSLILALGIVAALLLAGLIFNRLVIVRGQKKLIEEQHRRVEEQNRINAAHLENIERQKSQLEGLNSELETFAHIVSHDLKAPLNSITGLIELIKLEHEDLDEELTSKIEMIQGRTRHLSDLIQGILSYSKVSQQTMKKEVVNVNELLKQVVADIKNDKGVQINIEPEIPSVTANRVQLEQVFTNLISNGIKYNHRQRGEGKIWLNFSVKPQWLEFNVSDNGPGIPENIRSQVFDLFSTGDRPASRNSTGVGLAIVKKLIDQNGGTIKVESLPGQGSAFRFTWPKRNG